ARAAQKVGTAVAGRFASGLSGGAEAAGRDMAQGMRARAISSSSSSLSEGDDMHIEMDSDSNAWETDSNCSWGWNEATELGEQQTHTFHGIDADAPRQFGLGPVQHRYGTYFFHRDGMGIILDSPPSGSVIYPTARDIYHALPDLSGGTRHVDILYQRNNISHITSYLRDHLRPVTVNAYYRTENAIVYPKLFSQLRNREMTGRLIRRNLRFTYAPSRSYLELE
uniref:hypothetical protein n=1 Tax=Serratia fonticola TaxID=47917 RepID=UPI00301B7B18